MTWHDVIGLFLSLTTQQQTGKWSKKEKECFLTNTTQEKINALILHEWHINKYAHTKRKYVTLLHQTLKNPPTTCNPLVFMNTVAMI